MKILFDIFFVVAVGLVSLACLVGAYMSLHDNFFVVFFFCCLSFLPSKKRFVCSFSHVDTGFCFCYSCAVQRHTTYCCICCSFGQSQQQAQCQQHTGRTYRHTYIHSYIHLCYIMAVWLIVDLSSVLFLFLCLLLLPLFFVAVTVAVVFIIV